MPLRKIEHKNYSWVKSFKPFKPCMHPEHNPPSHMVFEPGEYEWECPGCGKITKFTVPYIGL